MSSRSSGGQPVYATRIIEASRTEWVTARWQHQGFNNRFLLRGNRTTARCTCLSPRLSGATLGALPGPHDPTTASTLSVRDSAGAMRSNDCSVSSKASSTSSVAAAVLASCSSLSFTLRSSSRRLDGVDWPSRSFGRGADPLDRRGPDPRGTPTRFDCCCGHSPSLGASSIRSSLIPCLYLDVGAVCRVDRAADENVMPLSAPRRWSLLKVARLGTSTGFHHR